jgi:phosphoserine aminotransferase
MKKLNFYAGPSYLNEDILAAAMEYLSNEDKLSFIEISHRSSKVVDFFEQTEQLIRELMNLQPDRKILFLHGGASLQYCMIAYNVLTKGTANFIDTGVWSSKAIEECSKIRDVNILWSGKNNNYLALPEDDFVTGENEFTHITTNNTIYGTQYSSIPKVSGKLVADMSSDILSRDMDFNAFDLIYAGFQKNLGTAGGCLTILNPAILDGDMSRVPSMLDYAVHIKNQSMFNTPPVFAVLMCKLTLDWIVKNGGLQAIENNNNKKAALLYDEIDRNPLFYNKIKREDRSKMNVVFRGIDEQVENRFQDFADKNNVAGIKGHRLSGGFRASLYNTLPLSYVETLVDLMKEFERRY